MTKDIKKDKKRGVPRSDEVKKKISEANRKSVRGFKMILKDEFDNITQELKVGYDDVIKFLNMGWEFKADRIWMNKAPNHMLKKSSEWRQHLEEGWKWGTLSHLNKVKCYHCPNYNCKIDHYSTGTTRSSK